MIWVCLVLARSLLASYFFKPGALAGLLRVEGPFFHRLEPELFCRSL